MTGFPINPPRTPLVDNQGLPTREWWIYFLKIQQAIGSGVSSPFDDASLAASSMIPPVDAVSDMANTSPMPLVYDLMARPLPLSRAKLKFLYG